MVSMGNTVYYTAKCKPEKKMEKLYELKLSVEVVGGDGRVGKTVTSGTFAEPSCPAGEAPFAS